MRAFEKLCASQGIDPRELKEAFVSDNMALTAQNELLRQELCGLGDALHSRLQPEGNAALQVVSQQGAEGEGDDDLNNVLSEALDFVSTKTGFAVNLVKQKVTTGLLVLTRLVQLAAAEGFSMFSSPLQFVEGVIGGNVYYCGPHCR